ncbi:MAG: DUF2207 domain-containing protein [Chloroflexi bacterium]|nr:DUF2207 domain-containing protein [Chloroflexota bacterium]
MTRPDGSSGESTTGGSTTRGGPGPLLVVLAALWMLVSAGTASAATPPGPPFPQPEPDRAVYDLAGIFSPSTIATAESIIDGIETRTGAEIIVYSQDAGYDGITTDETLERVVALIDQWGVGRAGFDDGAAIFFDLEPNLRHGQVQIYGAPGYEAAYLSNGERQALFDDEMLPLLRGADFDGALLVALERMDASATPEHAQRLELARQLNAAVGLVGAPVIFLGLVGSALFAWRRYGDDPVYLDDPSILMPAPPPDLTAASGALVVDGTSSRRALTTALLDLASRGLIAFREEPSLLRTKLGVDVDPPPGDALVEAHRARNARRPMSTAEELALRDLRSLGASKDGYIEPDELPAFGSSVARFDRALEGHVVERGWFREKPSKAVARWRIRGSLALILGLSGVVGGLSVPMSGLVMLGVAGIGAGIVLLVIARSMPAVTMPGAMIRAMLAAYRRTLKKTMDGARSMDDVVRDAGLRWLDTPDQAIVWGTALGLQDEIEKVLERSLDDVREGRATVSPYFPAWYGSQSGASFAEGGSPGSGASLFSSSGIPNIGSMMSALGTIGNSPSSSGGSSGGGFSGGSSGGGGGGSGGGF